jgi:polyisoprenoid-binding protein YceI
MQWTKMHIVSVIVDEKIRCTGKLTVAGVTKQIELDASYKMLPNGSLLVSGKKKLLMSDYNIEAPTFMFGTVTTGDEITVSFNVDLIPVKK